MGGRAGRDRGQQQGRPDIALRGPRAAPRSTWPKVASRAGRSSSSPGGASIVRRRPTPSRRTRSAQPRRGRSPRCSQVSRPPAPTARSPPTGGGTAMSVRVKSASTASSPPAGVSSTLGTPERRIAARSCRRRRSRGCRRRDATAGMAASVMFGDAARRVDRPLDAATMLRSSTCCGRRGLAVPAGRAAARAGAAR